MFSNCSFCLVCVPSTAPSEQVGARWRAVRAPGVHWASTWAHELFSPNPGPRDGRGLCSHSFPPWGPWDGRVYEATSSWGYGLTSRIWTQSTGKDGNNTSCSTDPRRKQALLREPRKKEGDLSAVKDRVAGGSEQQVNTIDRHGRSGATSDFVPTLRRQGVHGPF